MPATYKPNWQQGDGKIDYTAEDDRRLISAMFNSGGTPGVVWQPGDPPLSCFANPTPNNLVWVRRGQAVVKGTASDDQGCYVVTSGHQAVTIDPGDAANPRNDLVVIRVRDNQYDQGGADTGKVEYVKGTPAATPVDPATPASSLVLARVRVPKVPSGDTVITAAMIDDLRSFAASTGSTQNSVCAVHAEPQVGDQNNIPVTTFAPRLTAPEVGAPFRATPTGIEFTRTVWGLFTASIACGGNPQGGYIWMGAWVDTRAILVGASTNMRTDGQVAAMSWSGVWYGKPGETFNLKLTKQLTYSVNTVWCDLSVIALSEPSTPPTRDLPPPPPWPMPAPTPIPRN